MTNDEARSNPIYRDAYKNGGLRIIQKAVTLCRDIGKRLNANYGPKYRLGLDAGVYVYVDDYGNYSTISVNGKLVASTHFCDQYFIDGDWVHAIENACMTEPSYLGSGV